MQGAVRHAEVMNGLAQVELVHRRHQAGGACRTAQQLSKLLGEIRVRACGGGDHVQHTLPHLVHPVDAGDAAALQQLLDLLRRWVVEHQRLHGQSVAAVAFAG
jgi:hypothetical protein